MTTTRSDRRRRRPERARRAWARRLDERRASESAGQGSPTCECGEGKAPAADACPGCAWLDGEGKGPLQVIAALRGVGGEAPRETLELETRLSGRQILRIVRRLSGLGRVRREVRFDGLVGGRPRYRSWYRLVDDRGRLARGVSP